MARNTAISMSSFTTVSLACFRFPLHCLVIVARCIFRFQIFVRRKIGLVYKYIECAVLVLRVALLFPLLKQRKTYTSGIV